MTEQKSQQLRTNSFSSSNAQKQKNKGPYILGKTLGEGAFAKVKEATQIHAKEKVAIKILDKSRLLEDENDVQKFKKEISILKKLHHGIAQHRLLYKYPVV